MPTRIAVALLVLSVAGCSVEELPPPDSPPPSASASASVGPLPTGSPTVTPEPTLLVADPIFPPEPWPDAVIPDGRLVRTASERVDGVDVRITLDANPLVAGQPAWVTTELTNLGRDKLQWTEDGCGIHVGVSGRFPDLRWPEGAEQQGLAAKFKQAAFWNARMLDDRSVHINFVPEWAVGIGDFGCADIGIGKELRPGRRLIARQQWDGLLFQRAGLPPTSRAEIGGTFAAGWRRASDRPNRGRKEIVVRLPAWIQGVDSPRVLSVGEAVDVALTDDLFAEWVRVVYKGMDAWQAITELDPATGAWQIGLARMGGDTRIISVDSTTGSTGQLLRAKTDGGGGFKVLGPAN
jgi:hypothetical protein